MQILKNALMLFASSFIIGMATVSALDTKIIKPEEVKWLDSDMAYTHPGTQIAHLSGVPREDNMFALRIKFPPKAEIKLHTHPIDEFTTVISGSIHMGFGKDVDRTNAKTLPAGTFIVIPAGTPHFLWSDDGAVVQITGKGPWRIDYIKE